MIFVVIGTDHRCQSGDVGFEGLLRGLLGRQHFELLQTIAEEHNEKTIGSSICQKLALEHKPQLRWVSLDMTTAEKSAAAILHEQENRRLSSPNTRVPSDEVREQAWVKKLTESGTGTTFVICGYLHLTSLVRKLREKGHTVEQRVYLETVPEIKQ